MGVRKQQLHASPTHTVTFDCDECNRKFDSDDVLQRRLQDSPAHAVTLERNECDREFHSDSKAISQRECHSGEETSRPELHVSSLSCAAQSSFEPSPSPKHVAPNTNSAIQRLKEKTNTAARVKAWKISLIADGICCGAPTLKGTPCKNPTPPRNSERIASLLRSVSPMIKSWEALEQTLEELAHLIHCHLHDCGPPNESRVDTWLAAFPKGKHRSSSSVLIARKIRKALDVVSSQCAGMTKARKRCSSHIGGQKVQNCGKSITEVQ